MKKIIYSIAALFLCAPLLANAAEGWIVADISLQAGPDPEYPSIMELSADTPVTIEGCIDGWAWCDVIADGERGWVPGTYLQEEYSGQRVYVIDYGSRIGIPVVSFSLGLYWNSHYQNRPFYSQRQRWESRAIRPHAPPRPTGVAASRPVEQRPSTTTQERRAPTPTAAPAPAPKATTTTQREAPRSERSTEQRAPMQARPESQPARSDAAAQMRPTRTPQAEPQQQQRPMPKAQESKKAEPPKAKDEPKKPEKEKDNGGGK